MRRAGGFRAGGSVVVLALVLAAIAATGPGRSSADHAEERVEAPASSVLQGDTRTTPAFTTNRTSPKAHAAAPGPVASARLLAIFASTIALVATCARRGTSALAPAARGVALIGRRYSRAPPYGWSGS